MDHIGIYHEYEAEQDSAAAGGRDGFSASSFPPTRVFHAIPQSINLTFGAESRGKSTSRPLGAGQRREGGNIILRVPPGSRWINEKLYRS